MKLLQRYTPAAALLLLAAAVLTGCKKEIDFDYNETTPIVVIEGQVTNEGMSVRLTASRSMQDSVRGRCLTGATVQILVEGTTIALPYNTSTDSYHSPARGIPGKEYALSIDFEDRHYEATALMPLPAPIQSAEFLWQKVVTERLLAYEVWAVDPEPDVRNYYWCRMDRHSQHPHLQKFPKTEAYRWNVFDDRGCPPGLIYRDIMCMSERAADEDEEENWKSILYEGDTITLRLMTIDRTVYDFFSSLRAGQGGGANPRSNITGGCQGYFLAGSVTHADTVVFSRDIIKTR